MRSVFCTIAVSCWWSNISLAANASHPLSITRPASGVLGADPEMFEGGPNSNLASEAREGEGVAKNASAKSRIIAVSGDSVKAGGQTSRSKLPLDRSSSSVSIPQKEIKKRSRIASATVPAPAAVPPIETIEAPVRVDAEAEPLHKELDTEKKTPEVADSVTNGVKVEDIVETAEPYRFAGLDKPDPFLAPVTVQDSKKAESPDAEEIPIVSPLQYYDLKSLVVTGVWESQNGVWKAMIETPDRQGIIAKLQDSVGNSGGRITEISANGVHVREYRLRKDGSQEFTDRMITLSRDTDAGEKFLGGKIILSPGASNPEVKKPDPEDPSVLNSYVPRKRGLHTPSLSELQVLGATPNAPSVSDPVVPALGAPVEGIDPPMTNPIPDGGGL